MLSFENILDDFIESGKLQIAIIGKGKSIDNIDSKKLDEFPLEKNLNHLWAPI